jgi:hypothetical protein
MTDYNYLTYSQEQLNRAIELLNQNTSPNNYTVEAKTILEILSKTKPIYKKAYGTGEFVKVGKLTAKNEIIFDKPKTSLHPMTNNLGASSNVYYAGWFLLTEVNTEGDYYSYYEIVNRQMFNEILYDWNKYSDDIEVVNCPVLGFMMGDYRAAEVVFYDQYIE